MFNEIKTILNNSIDQMHLDAYTKYSKSPLVNNYYQEIDQEYAKFYINEITNKLQSATIKCAEANKLLLMDGCKCPEHIRPITQHRTIPYQINTSLTDIAKQRELAEVYKAFVSPHRLVFLDIETDSLHTNATNILQISLLEMECINNPTNPFAIKSICNSYIKPYDNYIINKNDQSTKIHQITQSQINNAPQFHEVAMDIADQTASTILVEFNIQCFDIPILH